MKYFYITRNKKDLDEKYAPEYFDFWIGENPPKYKFNRWQRYKKVEHLAEIKKNDIKRILGYVPKCETCIKIKYKEMINKEDY